MSDAGFLASLLLLAVGVFFVLTFTLTGSLFGVTLILLATKALYHVMEDWDE